jgi:3-methylcrotonyl-CoA carboxylase alpha subunit
VAVTRKIRRLLIANRGEIAVRIAKTCRAMGIETVAVYSDPDAGAPHVRACDAAVRIGPAPARESYLRIDRIVEAARDARADAVHPGYGFLSENAAFAQACADASLAFVGPPPSAIKAMGDKIAAKTAVEAAGVPTVPGYLGADQSDATLAREAERIGVPVLIKAAAGGGGKGMRVVHALGAIREALSGARREASAAFGDDRVFLERYLESPRHIEIQVLADAHGACIHLGERECSIQRRHQKVLEETPSTAVDERLRAEMGAAAIRAASAVGYVNAGTVEFMLDSMGRYYFLEMNTRLQVEHPVTELVTGVDLVREQIRIAEGAPLSLRQTDVAPRGHAIEVRVYAEDPTNGFLPSIGRITEFSPPVGPGLRNDAGVEAGSVVTVDYDPMLAKLIAYDRTREDCIGRLAAALDDYVVGGVVTNIAFLRFLVTHGAFSRGETSTAFIDRYFGAEALRDAHDEGAALLAAAAVLGAENWRHSAQSRTVSLEGRGDLTVTPAFGGTWLVSEGAVARGAVALAHDRRGRIMSNGRDLPFTAWTTARGNVAVNIHGLVSEFSSVRPPTVDEAAHGHRRGGHGTAGGVDAPMSGKIVKVEVAAGDQVKARQVLVVMEAMKMEHTIVAPYDGTITAVNVKAGEIASAGDALVEIDAVA